MSSPDIRDYGRVFFFNDTATTEIYTLSLHDALPICSRSPACGPMPSTNGCATISTSSASPASSSTIPISSPAACSSASASRSEEHTSELQSRLHLVCRLLLEKKNTTLRMAESTESRL